LNLLGEKRMKIQRSLLQKNKGVSEIIASLILVLIVTSAGVVAYSYSVGAFSSSTSLFQLDTNQKERQAQERFAIIAVWSNTSSQLNLTVLNYGQIDLTISAVYINWTSVADYLAGNMTTIGKGALVQVSFTSPVTIQSGSTYEIIVVSTRGSKNAINWKA
jgi:flagellin-like protein